MRQRDDLIVLVLIDNAETRNEEDMFNVPLLV